MMYGEDNNGSANFVFSLYVPITQLFYSLNFLISFGNFQASIKRMFFFYKFLRLVLLCLLTLMVRYAMASSNVYIHIHVFGDLN